MQVTRNNDARQESADGPQCPACGRQFPRDGRFCPHDGVELQWAPLDALDRSDSLLRGAGDNRSDVYDRLGEAGARRLHRARIVLGGVLAGCLSIGLAALLVRTSAPAVDAVATTIPRTPGVQNPVARVQPVAPSPLIAVAAAAKDSAVEAGAERSDDAARVAAGQGQAMRKARPVTTAAVHAGAIERESPARSRSPRDVPSLDDIGDPFAVAR